MTRFFRTAAAALILAIALPVRAAWAHPKLLSSTPSTGSSVAVSPPVITATFNEAITLGLSKLALHDAEGRAVALDSISFANGDRKTLAARPVATLSPGRYTVTWQAAGSDGHPMKGEFAFVVAPPAPGARSRVAAGR